MLKPKHRGHFWVLCLALIAVGLVSATFMVKLGVWPLAFARYGNLVNLAGENNLAAWFSGMLLFIAALHAFDGFVVARDIKPAPSRAWLAIFAVLVFFSADEVGSIHERLPYSIANCLGTDVAIGIALMMLPIALALSYGIAVLWLDRDYRGQTLGLCIGFGILASVPLMEYAEHNIDWSDSALVQALRLVVEEGTELFGMLILIASLLPNSRGLLNAGGLEMSSAFDLACYSRQRIFLFTLALLLLTSLWFTLSFHGDNRGHLASWLSCALLLFAGVTVVTRRLPLSGNHARLQWLLCGLCVAASALMVVQSPVVVGSATVPSRLLSLLVLLLAMGSIWWAIERNYARTGVLLIVCVVLAVAYLQQTTNLLVIFGLPCVAAALVLSIHNSLGMAAGVGLDNPNVSG